MYLNEEKNEKDDSPKMTTAGGGTGGTGRGCSGAKSMMNHKNKKYVRNIKPPLYDVKHTVSYSFNSKKIGKCDKIKRRLVNVNRVDINNNNANNNNNNNNNNIGSGSTMVRKGTPVGTNINNKMSQPLYGNQNMMGRNKEIMMPRMNNYKKTYFDHDNINYNTFINSLTTVCSLHIEKTQEEIKKQKEKEKDELILKSNRIHENYEIRNERDKNYNWNYEMNEESEYPTFVEEIRFTDNMVLLSGILILPNTDKIFGNLEFEGKTNPVPPDCNLSIFVNVVNKYNCQYYKKLVPTSYNFKNRIFFVNMNNNGTVDSTLWIDKFIIKGNFQTLSVVVLGQSEEMSEQLRSYNENIYDKNMRMTLDGTVLDVEHDDAERDERFAPRQHVEIKTYSVCSIIDAPFKCQKGRGVAGGDAIDTIRLERSYKKISSLANTLEQEFKQKNGIEEIGAPAKKPTKAGENVKEKQLAEIISVKPSFLQTQKDSGVGKKKHLIKDEHKNEYDEKGKMQGKINGGKNLDKVKVQKKVQGKGGGNAQDRNENIRNDSTVKEKCPKKTGNEKHVLKLKTMDKAKATQKITYFEPPREDLILKILNTFSKIYKKRKYLCLKHICAYEKILKFGALWIFYIYKELKNDEETFYLKNTKYIQVKLSDVLGALLILRRCALYSNLAECLIHMNVDTSHFFYDEKKPHILFYLLDLLRFDHIFFLASWKVKSAIAKTLVALTSNAYVMNLFCNYVSQKRTKKKKRKRKRKKFKKKRNYINEWIYIC